MFQFLLEKSFRKISKVIQGWLMSQIVITEKQFKTFREACPRGKRSLERIQFRYESFCLQLPLKEDRQVEQRLLRKKTSLTITS